MSETFRTYDESYPPDLWGGGTPPIVPATGATAGTPGSWTPTGSTAPANAAAATTAGIVASPATDWTIGQYVQGTDAGAAGEMNWSGTAWVAGKSAVVEEAAATKAKPKKSAAAAAPEPAGAEPAAEEPPP